MKAKTVTVQLEKEAYDFLKKFSLERSGKVNLSSGIRVLIKERMDKKCKCL